MKMEVRYANHPEDSKHYTTEDLRFEVNDESRLNNILLECGGINIANNNGILTYILPLNKK